VLRAAPAVRRSAVAPVAAMASSRPLWQPGDVAPAHLTGSLPGDYGFDPLGLGKEPAALKWYVQAELQNARWAMAAVAGILIPDILTHIGVLSVPLWTTVGEIKFDFAPTASLFAVQMILFHFVENKRYRDFVKPGSQGEPGSFFGFEAGLAGTGEPGYPGGPFDPLGLSKTKDFAKYKVNEIANGRLAMLAFAGFAGQAASTGKGPVDNLLDHLASPFTVTVATNTVAIPHILDNIFTL